MFDIGLQEMVLIGVIALLVFGPSKLPELGRVVGRAMREFRRASEEFRSTVETNLQLNETDPVIAPPAVSSFEDAVADQAEAATTEAAASVEAEREAIDALPPAEPTDPYLAQRGSRLFHRATCAWATRIPEAERVSFKALSDATDLGYARCPMCEPWEPA